MDEGTTMKIGNKYAYILEQHGLQIRAEKDPIILLYRDNPTNSFSERRFRQIFRHGILFRIKRENGGVQPSTMLMFQPWKVKAYRPEI